MVAEAQIVPPVTLGIPFWYSLCHYHLCTCRDISSFRIIWKLCMKPLEFGLMHALKAELLYKSHMTGISYLLCPDQILTLKG